MGRSGIGYDVHSALHMPWLTIRYCLNPRRTPHHTSFLHAREQVDGVRRATPLLLVLMCIELSDVVFAVDSIPAVFAVTKVTWRYPLPHEQVACLLRSPK